MVETASTELPLENSAPIINNENGHLDEKSSVLQPETVDLTIVDRPQAADSSESSLSDLDDLQLSPGLPTDVPWTNGHGSEQDLHDDEPPAKRRRVRESTPPNSSLRRKPESPPWKRAAAEGPSSFTENGMRKSGRINTVPLELQRGDKRITRRSLHTQKGTSSSKNKYASTNGHASSPPAPTSDKLRRLSSTTRPTTAKPGTSSTAKSASRKASLHDVRSRPKARRRSSSSASSSSSSSPPRPRKINLVTPPKASAGTRRSSRVIKESSRATDSYEAQPGSSPRTTRIKLRVRQPLTDIPLVHPGQAKVRPRIGPTFEEYFARAGQIPVEEGGMLIPDDGPRYTDEMARSEAKAILRIEAEAEDGGLLTVGRCAAFLPEPEEEPPRQWAQMDHLVKAMTNFRKLMLMEQQRHRAAAKRVAEACRLEWRRRNPQAKTAEEIEEEARRFWDARYRVVVKAMLGTWENVRVEINRRRLEEWEAEEQRRVKAALNEAVNISEQKLQARQARFASEDYTGTDDIDEDEDDDDDDDGSDDEGDVDSDEEAVSVSGSNEGEDDESNMSSSDDDEDKASVLSDEGLTQEQLREKYAGLPQLEKVVTEDNDHSADDDAPDHQDLIRPDDDADETSDESIDMDDDLGSTDMDSDEEEEDDAGSDGDAEDSEEEEPSGLLGLFFGKSELKKIRQEADTEEPSAVAEDVEMADVASPARDAPVDATDDEVDQLALPPIEAEEATDNRHEEPALDGVTQQPTLSTAPAAKHSSSEGEEVAADGQLAGRANDKQDPPGDNAIPVESSELLTTVETKEPDAVEGNTEDIVMAEVSSSIGRGDATAAVPGLEVTGPAGEAKQTSPETDGVTNAPSPSRSQSPRTSVTKPSDVDTASSVEPAGAQKVDSDSRSPSPQPQAAAKTEIPFLLRGTLREYQHYGLDWLAGLYANKTNGILADEMGLGKTIQTIALLAHLACHHEVWGPHLIIVPTSVMLNWEMEFKKWCPAFKILTYYGTQDERKRKRHGWNNDDIWNVCITSYQMVLQDQQVFKRRRWHYMVLDEAHNIKNFKSQRWQTLLGFNTHSRLLLTGTPLQNNLTELWSLLFFLMPPENGEGGFADLHEFHDWFHKPESQILESGREQMDDEARAIISKLHKVLRPYLLRRLKADVEKQMPAKYEHVEFCRLSKRQRELYDGFLARSETRDTLSSGNYLSIINCLMQLRKVCNHPDLFVDRPIMTSFRMHGSVPGDFLETEYLIKHKLLAEKPMSTVSLSFLNLIPTLAEVVSSSMVDRVAQLSSQRVLMEMRDAQKLRAQNAYTSLDPATIQSNIVYLESAARWGRFEELQHCVYLNALRRQRRPIYGRQLVELLTLGVPQRPYKPRPKVPKHVLAWFEDDSFLLHTLTPTLNQRAASLEMILTKFACVTPAVVTRDMNEVVLGSKTVQSFRECDLRLSAPVKYAPFMPREAPPDPWHEARMRLSIQFPDKRLLQYDCGKLQALDKLLRRLQSGGHRALIFTQMTKVLDILELFLNIHGHKYLRLDGATKVEQRQILTDRFNADPRIPVFILSTRSGGLGINLTGADTVIFYDQDWNPAMDRQCQDRCHRIGQTRDVHIYRLVSEHTIEANILRKASQKQMLDDVVIQEGEFTTDYFTNKGISVRDVIDDDLAGDTGDAAVANAAMDRVLGGVDSAPDERGAGRVLEQAEDTEDVAAARVAEKEITQDDADFSERPTPTASGTPREGSTAPASGAASVSGQAHGKTPGPSGLGLFVESAEVAGADGEAAEVEYNADGGRIHTVDDYMLGFMAVALKGTPLEIPKDKKKGKTKKGKDMRKR